MSMMHAVGISFIYLMFPTRRSFVGVLEAHCCVLSLSIPCNFSFLSRLSEHKFFTFGDHGFLSIY